MILNFVMSMLMMVIGHLKLSQIRPQHLNEFYMNLPHIHPHAFRHTAASTMILNGVDMVSAAAELGHASPSTTANIYAHQFAIARAKAASVRAGVFANRK